MKPEVVLLQEVNNEDLFTLTSCFPEKAQEKIVFDVQHSFTTLKDCLFQGSGPSDRST